MAINTQTFANLAAELGYGPAVLNCMLLKALTLGVAVLPPNCQEDRYVSPMKRQAVGTTAAAEGIQFLWRVVSSECLHLAHHVARVVVERGKLLS